MDIQTETKPQKRKRTIAYLGIVAVVFVWGLYPVFTSDLLGVYSGGAFTLASSLVSAVVLLPECLPKLKYIDRSYFKVAVPTGFVVGAANLLQKIGLTYTTPTRYAFLENLSCVVVPILLFLFIRKKPHPLTISASLLCLAGCFIMSGVSGEGVSIGAGEILCALAGVLYGVNIAATGVFAVRMNAMLYVMIQMCRGSPPSRSTRSRSEASRSSVSPFRGSGGIFFSSRSWCWRSAPSAGSSAPRR